MKINFSHLIAFIWACLISILWLIFMTGCSASYHYGKAVKKGMRCETISDTIEIQKIDSVFINNEWVKYVTKYDTIVRYNEVFVPKTRLQERLIYKIKRDSIEVVKYKVKTEYKTTKKKWNFPIKILIICFALGFVIALAKVYLRR
jgi:RsiW-degrading membrane proteinase PrsW (M82 family)